MEYPNLRNSGGYGSDKEEGKEETKAIIPGFSDWPSSLFFDWDGTIMCGNTHNCVADKLQKELFPDDKSGTNHIQNIRRSYRGIAQESIEKTQKLYNDHFKYDYNFSFNLDSRLLKAAIENQVKLKGRIAIVSSNDYPAIMLSKLQEANITPEVLKKILIVSGFHNSAGWILKGDATPIATIDKASLAVPNGHILSKGKNLHIFLANSLLSLKEEKYDQLNESNFSSVFNVKNIINQKFKIAKCQEELRKAHAVFFDDDDDREKGKANISAFKEFVVGDRDAKYEYAAHVGPGSLFNFEERVEKLIKKQQEKLDIQKNQSKKIPEWAKIALDIKERPQWQQELSNTKERSPVSTSPNQRREELRKEISRDKNSVEKQ